MKGAGFFLTVVFICGGFGGRLNAETLDELVADLRQHGATVGREGEWMTFHWRGMVRAEHDAWFADRLGRRCREARDFNAAALRCEVVAGSGSEHLAWEEGSRRCGAVVATLRAQGVAANNIDIAIQTWARNSTEVSFTVLLHRKREWFARMGNNMVGGLTTVIVSPAQVAKGIANAENRNGPIAAGTIGVVNGFGSAVRQAGNGLFRIVTFWANNGPSNGSEENVRRPIQ